MSDFRDEHMIQSDEELRGLEDEHPAERGPSRRSQDGLDLPKPLYRVKAMHSNETFFAFFSGPFALGAEAGEPAPSGEQTAGSPGPPRFGTSRPMSPRSPQETPHPGPRKRILHTRARRRGCRRFAAFRPDGHDPAAHLDRGADALRPRHLRSAGNRPGTGAHRSRGPRQDRAHSDERRHKEARGQQGEGAQGLRNVQAKDSRAQSAHETRLRLLSA